MTRALWINPFNGIAGDMMLGALFDAGADAAEVMEGLERLAVPEWTLRVDTVERGALRATDVHVDVTDDRTHRTADTILRLIDDAGLPARVATRSRAVFEALAQAEADVHGVEPSDVHFHEVGGVDAIVDIVGACLAIESLAVDRVVVAPVATGVGITGSMHGPIPHPAPATLRLLEGVPTTGLDVGVELTTPTGAALVAALADRFGPLPPIMVESSGYGAGDAELDPHPNLLQVVVGEELPTGDAEELVLLEANVDDLSAEYLAHAIDALIDAGALDAWLTPIRMKKERQATLVSALVRPTAVGPVRDAMHVETGSLGVRARPVDRWALARRTDTVVVDGHEIRVKVSSHTIKAEYADVVHAAAALDRPARAVAAEAERRWTEGNT